MALPPPGSSPAATLFPVVDALEAFEAWSADPGERSRRLVAEALGAIVRAVGGEGGYVTVDRPPLPALEIGWGSLADARPDVGDATPRAELHGESGMGQLGTLWLDRGEVAVAARAIAAALHSAWARAALRQTAGRLSALDDATRGIAEVLDVGAVLQLIVDRVRELVGAGYAAIGIVDEAGAIERFITSGITPAQRALLGPPPRGP